jgi:hypothetical protein
VGGDSVSDRDDLRPAAEKMTASARSIADMLRRDPTPDNLLVAECIEMLAATVAELSETVVEQHDAIVFERAMVDRLRGTRTETKRLH